ncbi:MAG: VanZ family protein [Aureibaculum sp.]
MLRLIKRLLERNAYTIAVFFTLFITFISLVSLKGMTQIKMENSDKLGHFLAYFLLSLSWFSALKNKFNNNLIIILLISYGIIIEVLQEVLTVHRQADFKDVLANSMGVILAYLLYQKINIKHIG